MKKADFRLIVGTTGSGKSYYAEWYALNRPGPALWWNPQDQKPAWPGVWARADANSPTPRALRSKTARIMYVPSPDTDKAAEELDRLINWIMGRIWSPPLHLMLDEIDEHAPQGRPGTSPARVAKRGRKQSITADFITQFPAELTKEVVRNCDTQIHFRQQFAGAYYKRYGIPAEELFASLAGAPEYAFVRWSGLSGLSKPMQVKGRVIVPV